MSVPYRPSSASSSSPQRAHHLPGRRAIHPHLGELRLLISIIFIDHFGYVQHQRQKNITRLLTSASPSWPRCCLSLSTAVPPPGVPWRNNLSRNLLRTRTCLVAVSPDMTVAQKWKRRIHLFTAYQSQDNTMQASGNH